MPLQVSARYRDGRSFPGRIALYDKAGEPLLRSGGGRLEYALPVSANERWYYARIENEAGEAVAYTSPVWVRSR